MCVNIYILMPFDMIHTVIIYICWDLSVITLIAHAVVCTLPSKHSGVSSMPGSPSPQSDVPANEQLQERMQLYEEAAPPGEM